MSKAAAKGKEPVKADDVVVTAEKVGTVLREQRQEQVTYIFTFVFGLATLVALILAIVQTIRSIRLDQVLLEQNQRLARIDRALMRQLQEAGI